MIATTYSQTSSPPVGNDYYSIYAKTLDIWTLDVTHAI